LSQDAASVTLSRPSAVAAEAHGRRDVDGCGLPVGDLAKPQAASEHAVPTDMIAVSITRKSSGIRKEST
jgi:hypothetical protein